MTHKNKVIQGSQGAGKTYNILSRWVLMANASEEKELITITSSTYPSLRTGAMTDLVNILDNEGIDYSIVTSPNTIITVRNWTFEFRVFANEKLARGPRRQRLFINEADRMPWGIARHLIGRTSKERIFDFNPVLKFWAHIFYVDVNECSFVKLTYKDNEKLPISEVESIEKHSPWGSNPDENYWRVFGLGEIGFAKGQILRYKIYDDFLENPDLLIAYGVDWGWNDAMTCVKVYIDHKNERLYWRELFYGSKCKEADLHKSILSTEPFEYFNESEGKVLVCKGNPEQYNTHEVVWCDHDPRARRDMLKAGISARNAIKKTIAGRVQSINKYELFIHKDSTNLIREAGAWVYKSRIINGMEEFTPIPDPDCEDHGMDAASYGSVPLMM